MENKRCLPAIEINPKERPRFCIIWMHGLGADGHDFEPVAQQLQPRLAQPTRFVLPHAPQMPVTINGGMSMPAWFDIIQMESPKKVDFSTVESSAEEVQRLIDREVAHGLLPDQIFLAGFSQGGSMALHVALRQERALGGVIALSTLWLEHRKADEAPANHPDVPIFMAHGTEDTVIEPEEGRASAEALRQRGFTVDFHEYPMPHAVCPEELQALLTWINVRQRERR